MPRYVQSNKKADGIAQLAENSEKGLYPREKKNKVALPSMVQYAEVGLHFTVCVYIAGHGSQFYLSNIVENRIQIHNGVLLPFYTYQIHNRVPFFLHLLR